MRAIAIFFALLIAFAAGGYVEHMYGWPWSVLIASSAPPLPNGVSSTTGSSSTAPLPYYSRARGAEDPPRDPGAAGAAIDMQRCVNTMIQRRESEQEARTVCQKIITGIGG